MMSHARIQKIFQEGGGPTVLGVGGPSDILKFGNFIM